jgi:hypothetical protein
MANVRICLACWNDEGLRCILQYDFDVFEEICSNCGALARDGVEYQTLGRVLEEDDSALLGRTVVTGQGKVEAKVGKYRAGESSHGPEAYHLREKVS